MILLQVLEASPCHPEAFFWLSNQLDLSQEQSLIKKLELCYENNSPNLSNDYSFLCYALAKLREDQHRYFDAFNLYDQANKCRQSELNLFRTDYNIYLGQSRLHRDLFEPLSKMPNYVLGSSIGKDLIFIVGLPRCGSTLVEAILSMSGNAECFGESGYLQESISAIGILGEIERGNLDNAQIHHKFSLVNAVYNEKVSCKKNLKIDKTLTNFYLAGLISRIWPAAKIIHVKRSPMDQILSAWKSRFRKGHSYTLNLNDLIKVYISYKNLMDFWEINLGSRIYTCQYEELVTNPIRQTKKLAIYCGIEWNEKMLSPKDSKLLIKTASFKQVREPIYDSSIGAWKNYYPQLEKYAQKLVDESIDIDF